MNAYRSPLLRSEAASDASLQAEPRETPRERTEAPNTEQPAGLHPKARALQGIGDMVQASLDALLDCVKGENVKDGSRARNHQTRMMAARYVLDVVLDRMPDAASADQEQLQRLSPEDAVAELRKRLTVAK